MHIQPGWFAHVTLKLNSGDLQNDINKIENVWSNIFPGRPFEYFLLDDKFNQLYTDDFRTQKIFNIFSMLAIIISCLGLFGLSAFIAEKKTKEIGIRKILGASVPGIIKLVSKEFVYLVLISIALSYPIANYFLNSWIQNFEYKTELGISVYLFSGIFALAIGLVTVSYHAFRAANTNPVKTLKHE